MSLPKLHSAKYSLKLPSTGKRIEYRPFTVKDQKALMVAKESQDKETMIITTKDLIRNCTDGKLDPDTLTICDLEYFFLKLRASSVGETSDVTVKCEKCSTRNEVTLNLEDLRVTEPKVEKKLKLTDTIGIVLKAPALDTGLEIIDLDPAENLAKIIGICIETIYDENSVYDPRDYSEKDLTEFIESFSSKQLSEVANFIRNQPKVVLDVGFTCVNCGTQNKLELGGLQNFF